MTHACTLAASRTNTAISNQNVLLCLVSRHVTPFGRPPICEHALLPDAPSGRSPILAGASLRKTATIGTGIVNIAQPAIAKAFRQPKLAINRCATTGIAIAPRPKPTIIPASASPLRRSNQRDTTNAYGTVVVADATTPSAM